jgi:peroxiredoxin
MEEHPLVNQKFPHWKYQDRIAGEWVVKSTKDLVGPSAQHMNVQDRGEWKKGIIFGLPGAFTPTCSTQQLPNFELLYDEFKEEGVDYIGCVSVNDPFVMNAWFKDQKIKKVIPLPDGNFLGTTALGMKVEKTNLNFGPRSWRYALLIDRGYIVKVFEEPGKEDNHPEDPYSVSSPENILKYIRENDWEFTDFVDRKFDDWGHPKKGDEIAQLQDHEEGEGTAHQIRFSNSIDKKIVKE